MWRKQRGEFLSAVPAAPMYQLFGHERLGAADLPAPNRSIGQRMDHRVRAASPTSLPVVGSSFSILPIVLAIPPSHEVQRMTAFLWRHLFM